MYSIRHGTRIRIDTPAKLNLFLELRRRRFDGYHELETLMVPINVYDSVVVEPRDDDQIKLHGRWVTRTDSKNEGLPAPDDNLVFKALIELRRRAGGSRGANVWLHKRIPSQAGLGGASSNAAAALVAGNVVWNLGWSTGELAKCGAALGSDVPFFLFGAAAVCTGRGEVVSPLTRYSRLAMALIKPPAGLSTPGVYRNACVPRNPESVAPLRSALEIGRLSEIGRLMRNRLQSAAAQLTEWIGRLSSAFQELDVVAHQMSGSGTSYFALCRNDRHARQVTARLRTARLGHVLSVSTIGPQAA